MVQTQTFSAYLNSRPSSASPDNLAGTDAGVVVTTPFQQDLINAGDVRLFGAACNLVCLQRAAMTAGSAVFTSTDALFTQADVGKPIGVTGAGAAGASLSTTIVSVQFPTQCTLAIAAGTTVNSSTGSSYIDGGVTAQAGAKAFYGTDDTAAIQAAIDYAHPRDGVVYIPPPGCMVLGTLYVQTSTDTSGLGLFFRRLYIQGIAPAIQSGLSGSASPHDSTLFRPTPGDIMRVNLSSSGEARASDHQFYNFGIANISFHGLPGNDTTGMKLHRVRATVLFCSFNNLGCGWNGIDPDINGVQNYCDQWTVTRPRFNACKALFKQANPDSCIWDNILAESFNPGVVTAIELFGGRGWSIRAPLINQLPSTAQIGSFSQIREGRIEAGHFERIYGKSFTISGSSSNGWVDILNCDFFNPDVAGITEDTIRYTGAGGKVEGCGFSQNRLSGFDINFGAGRWQQETRNQFFTEDNVTRRFPSINFTVSSGSGGTSFHQKYFVEVIYTGSSFDIRTVNGSSVLNQIFSGNPSFDIVTGRLNLDGAARWGRPLKALVQQKAGKYLPVLIDVQALGVYFYDSAGAKVLTPDTNMDFYLEVS